MPERQVDSQAGGGLGNDICFNTYMLKCPERKVSILEPFLSIQ